MPSCPFKWQCLYSKNKKALTVSEWDSNIKSQQVSNVHRHFFNLCVVELLDVFHRTHIVICHKIYCNTFPAKSAAASNAVQVIFSIGWKIEIDHKRPLLHVNAPCKQVSGYEDT